MCGIWLNYNEEIGFAVVVDNPLSNIYTHFQRLQLLSAERRANDIEVLSFWRHEIVRIMRDRICRYADLCWFDVTLDDLQSQVIFGAGFWNCSLSTRTYIFLYVEFLHHFLISFLFVSPFIIFND